MRLFRLAFLFAAGLGWSSLLAVDDPDVGDYGFGHVKKHTQTDTGVVTAQANPYAFQVFVGGDGSHISNATISVPGANAATYNISGNADFKFGVSYLSSGYTSTTQLDSVFPRSGGYSMHFETPQNPTGYTVNSLGLGGADFTNLNVPQVTGGGTWSSGSLLVDVTNESNFLTFSSFTGMNEGTDYIILDLWSTSTYHAMTSSSQYDGSSFYIGQDQQTHAPYLVVGDSYQASITYLKVIHTDSSVPTASSELGYSFMAYRTYFTVQAVPEPSTYVLLAAGLGLVGFRQWRRRR